MFHIIYNIGSANNDEDLYNADIENTSKINHVGRSTCTLPPKVAEDLGESLHLSILYDLLFRDRSNGIRCNGHLKRATGLY